MEECELNGVVVITLPPPDNPSQGKTINSIFTYFSKPHTNTSPPSPPPSSLSPSPPPQHPLTHHFSFKSLFNTPRRALGTLSISLLALLLWTSFPSNTLQDLQNSASEQRDRDDPPVTSFVFPLYSKLETPKEAEIELGKAVRRDGAVMLTDGVQHKEIQRVGSLISSSSSASLSESSTIFPVTGNVYPYGLYYVSLLVGSPPRPYHLDIDTGSDLTWIQCDAPCTSCAKGPHAPYKPTKETIVSSNDLLCNEVQSTQRDGDCLSCQCDYEVQYADHSSSMGVLAKDELQLRITNGTLLSPGFVFGCGYDQTGQLSVSPAKTDGVLGLNRAKIALPSQLANEGVIQNVVGHCIARDMDSHGYMFLGDDFLPQWGMTWVSMLHDPSINSYHTDIVKITYGSEQLSLGVRGHTAGQVLFDSGSSYTYFPKEAYYDLIASLEDNFGKGLIQDKSDPTLPMCWRAESSVRSVKDVKSFFRPLTLHFPGKWWIMSRKLVISPENYLIISNKGNVCLGILDGNDVHDGSTIILGDISLRGQLVVYDNVNHMIGWMKSDCPEPTPRKSFKGLPFFV